MLTIKETKELLGAEKPIICTSLIDTFNTYVRRRTMAKKERKELTEYQLQRKAEREADGAMAQADRREVKKERKSVVKEVHKELLDAFMRVAEEGVTVYRGDAKRHFRLEENFNGTSTTMLASIVKAAKKIGHLGTLAEWHLESRHLQSKESKKINERITKSINRRIKKGKLERVIKPFSTPDCAKE